MIRNSASCVWTAIAIAVFLAGCVEGAPPLQPWADDVKITNAEWDPLPEKIELEAGYRLDLTLSFKWSREAGMMEERPVRPPAEWLVTATVFTLDGDISEPTPWSYQREFRDAAEHVGTERRMSDDSLVWVSPDPPENMQPGRRYLWGRVEMPKEPGTYRLVVNVYPTVKFPTDPNPDRGPAEELYSTLVHVKPASEPPPAVMGHVEPFHPILRLELDRERGRVDGRTL